MQFRSLADPPPRPDLAGFGNCALERGKGFSLWVRPDGQPWKYPWLSISCPSSTSIIYEIRVFSVKTWSQESLCFLSTLFTLLT